MNYSRKAASIARKLAALASELQDLGIAARERGDASIACKLGSVQELVVRAAVRAENAALPSVTLTPAQSAAAEAAERREQTIARYGCAAD